MEPQSVVRGISFMYQNECLGNNQEIGGINEMIIFSKFGVNLCQIKFKKMKFMVIYGD